MQLRTVRAAKSAAQALLAVAVRFPPLASLVAKAARESRGAEPRFSPLFVVDQPWYKLVTTHGVAGFKFYPRTVVDHGLVAFFQAARLPQLSPVEPFDAATVQRIKDLHSRLQEQMQ